MSPRRTSYHGLDPHSALDGFAVAVQGRTHPDYTQEGDIKVHEILVQAIDAP